MRKLTFSQLRSHNIKRCQDSYHGVNEWSAQDWACAMAGECGEVCNLIKKMRRGEVVDAKMIADEIADLVIYADLLAARLGINLGEAVRNKFNEVSNRIGSSTFIRGNDV